MFSEAVKFHKLVKKEVPISKIGRYFHLIIGAMQKIQSRDAGSVDNCDKE